MKKGKNSYDDISIPVYLFHQGTNFHAYELLGCHERSARRGRYEYVFRVWAPNADSAALVGDFCSWDKGIPMVRISQGIWECVFVSKSRLRGSFYKFRIERGGISHLKSDPYAFASQTLENTASIISSPLSLGHTDSEWMEHRRELFSDGEHYYPSPMNIYELHLGSWRTRDGASTADGGHYLGYREIADMLAPYLRDMGYTHAELMPIAEHPFDGSWGYQICSYYAPTSRFGAPEDFAYFVDRLHEYGIGVILDWVPAHFPKDEHGLYEFDGGPLYEYQGEDRREHKGWGTRCFDVGRCEVQSFLISNALFWLREYHVDGLRIDAVASMLYLDYDRKPGEWIPNIYGGNENLEAIAFFRKLNSAVFAEFPDVLMIAEESTAFPGVTKPVSEGGLGFNFKWNMGFANDMFEYISMDPIYRQYHHSKLTFPMMYAYSENFILPVSHDEVVHGKRSLIGKMYGEYDEKFAMMRAFMTFLMTMPGKKLTFMGTEFAQFREWDYENELEWFMLSYPRHAEMQRYLRRLNHLYLNSPELWRIDDGWDGFSWLEADRARDNVVAYRRLDGRGGELVVVINFSPVDRPDYPIMPPRHGKYRILLDSDRYEFGGGEKINSDLIKTENAPSSSDIGRAGATDTRSVGEARNEKAPALLRLMLPAYSAQILKKTSNRARPHKSASKPESACGCGYNNRKDSTCTENLNV